MSKKKHRQTERMTGEKGEEIKSSMAFNICYILEHEVGHHQSLDSSKLT